MNTLKLIVAVIALVGATFILTTCDLFQVKLPSEVLVCESDNGQQVSVVVGQTLVIQIEGNPTTGYIWEWSPMTASEHSILLQAGEAEHSPFTNLPGSPGMTSFRFQVIGAGSELLKLIYHRPWEEGVEPIETFEVFVVAQVGKEIGEAGSNGLCDEFRLR